MEITIAIVAFVIGWVLTKRLGCVVKTQGGGESALLGRLIGAGLIAALIYGGAMKILGGGTSSDTESPASIENRVNE